MSQATLRVLDRKIRRWEIETVEDLREVVEAAIPTLRLPRFPQLDSRLRAWLDEFQAEVRSAGMFFLSMTQAEGWVALRKDVANIAGQLGVDPDPVLDGHDRQATIVNAARIWDTRLDQIFSHVAREIVRQGKLAELYTIDLPADAPPPTPVEPGWRARVVSPDRLAVTGRKGRGVVWIVPGLARQNMIQVGYGMVNEERIRVVAQVGQ